MRVWIRSAALAGICLMPLSAAAAPITAGVWSPVGTPDEKGASFWDNPSVDCDCNAGQALLGMGYDNVEFLHDGSYDTVAFSFADPILDWKPLFSKTSLTDGTPGQMNSAITYDTKPGRSNSFRSNSVHQPGQFALFRQVDDDITRYFIAFEDIPVQSPKSDRDYNDLIMTFTQVNVPEPSSLLLLGTAMAALTARRLRRRG